MRASDRLRRLLLLGGLALLAVYAGIRLDGALRSRTQRRAFEHQRDEQRSVRPRRVLPDRPATVDFDLWSSRRVQQFLAAMEKGAPPAVAILKISKIGLEVPVLHGTDELALNRGVGWIAGTARPGSEGNIGIAGHRDGFFRGLKDIRPGDVLELETLDRQDQYVVDAIEIVTPRDSSVLRPRGLPSLTLVTCYPFYFVGDAPQRYIVRAARVPAAPMEHVAAAPAPGLASSRYHEGPQ